MPCGVLVALLERCNQRLCERHVRPLQILSKLPLLLIHPEKPLSGKCRDKEQQRRPRRKVKIREGQYRDSRRVKGDGCSEQREYRPHHAAEGITPTDLCRYGAKKHVDRLGGESGSKRGDDQSPEVG